MSKYKPKARHSTDFDGFVGTLKDEQMYEDVKWGRRDWKPHVKRQMSAVTIPVDVFYRLLEMDRQVSVVPFEGSIISEEGVK